MTVFDVVRGIYEVKEYAEIVYSLAHQVDSSEAFAERLMEEVPETGQCVLEDIARRGDYPLCLAGMQ